jgi:hypothetical protein
MHATSIDPPLPSFDKLSFLKYVKNIGREYRQQAIKLVSFCRTFAQAQKQTRSCYDEFRRYYSQIMPILSPVLTVSKSVLQVIDEALYSATEAGKKTTKDADAKFKTAIDALSAYEMKYHRRETVTQTMAEAEAKDTSSSTILKKLKETFRVREDLAP